jgi:hypothetical protein
MYNRKVALWTWIKRRLSTSSPWRCKKETASLRDWIRDMPCTWREVRRKEEREEGGRREEEEGEGDLKAGYSSKYNKGVVAI